MEDGEQRLSEVAQIAVTLEKQSGCPAQLLIAQWAIESQWGEKPVGHANYFGIKRAVRHTKFCTVTTHEVFTPRQLGIWNSQHADRPARLISTLPDGRVRVELDDEFADYDSLGDSCADYAWLIANGQPYRNAWQCYLIDKNIDALIGSVAQIYATAPQYAQMVIRIASQQNLLNAIAGGESGQIPA
jgi:flagellum-specific peptidoglycan hydrolase FlgJ